MSRVLPEEALHLEDGLGGEADAGVGGVEGQLMVSGEGRCYGEQGQKEPEQSAHEIS